MIFTRVTPAGAAAVATFVVAVVIAVVVVVAVHVNVKYNVNTLGTIFFHLPTHTARTKKDIQSQHQLTVSNL